MAIQPVPSDCSSTPATGSAADRSNGPTLSSPRKPPSKTLLPLGVLAVDPPGEVQQQLVHHPGEEVEVARRRRSRTPAARPRRAPAGSRRRTPTRTPGSGRWGACTTRAAAAAAAPWRSPGRPGRCHAVEGQVPGRVPGVLPRVGHRDDVEAVHVPPGAVAPVPAAGRRRRRSPGRRPATGRRRSGRTACPTSARRWPAGPPGPPRRWPPPDEHAGEELRPPRPCAGLHHRVEAGAESAGGRVFGAAARRYGSAAAGSRPCRPAGTSST